MTMNITAHDYVLVRNVDFIKHDKSKEYNYPVAIKSYFKMFWRLSKSHFYKVRKYYEIVNIQRGAPTIQPSIYKYNRERNGFVITTKLT